MVEMRYVKVSVSDKTKEIESEYLSRMMDDLYNIMIEALTKLAEQMYKELMNSDSHDDMGMVLKVTEKDVFIEAVVGDCLIGYLEKYKAIHPDFGNGSIKIDERKFPAIYQWSKFS